MVAGGTGGMESCCVYWYLVGHPTQVGCNHNFNWTTATLLTLLITGVPTCSNLPTGMSHQVGDVHIPNLLTR